MKIRVRIKRRGGLPEQVVMAKTRKGKLIIEKPKKNLCGWTPEIAPGSIYQVREWGKTFNVVDIIENAEKTISYDIANKTANIPIFDRETSQQFITAETLKNRGAGRPQKTSLILWIIVLMQFVTIAFLLFGSRLGIR